MIDITIDDKKISAKEGQTILQLAQENGIKIPHLCFHAALKPSGSCKLCGVEVASPSGKQVVMLSCIIKAKKNLIVKTNSTLVKAKREEAFNKLLQMAPESSSIRALAKEFDVSVTSPPNGCIRCRLCIRVCNEVIKAKALKMVKTENGNMVVPQAGRCIGCGTCANLCPTNIIKMVDEGRVRTVSIKEEVVEQLPLERCKGCGKMFTTSDFHKFVEKSITTNPDTKEQNMLCPSCKKSMSNIVKAEEDKIKK